MRTYANICLLLMSEISTVLIAELGRELEISRRELEGEPGKELGRQLVGSGSWRRTTGELLGELVGSEAER